jgi:hypothetical protein
MTSAELAHEKVTTGVWALRELYEAQGRQLKMWQKRAEDEKRVRAELEQKPSEYTQGWFEKRETELRERDWALNQEMMKLRTYMRMKDLAKIKVERVRDHLQRENAVLRGAHEERLQLRAQNEKQATAYAALERENRELANAKTQLQWRLNNIMSALQNGERWDAHGR